VSPGVAGRTDQGRLTPLKLPDEALGLRAFCRQAHELPIAIADALRDVRVFGVIPSPEVLNLYRCFVVLPLKVGKLRAGLFKPGAMNLHLDVPLAADCEISQLPASRMARPSGHRVRNCGQG
jgi:hypothetical protein